MKWLQTLNYMQVEPVTIATHVGFSLWYGWLQQTGIDVGLKQLHHQLRCEEYATRKLQLRLDVHPASGASSFVSDMNTTSTPWMIYIIYYKAYMNRAWDPPQVSTAVVLHMRVQGPVGSFQFELMHTWHRDIKRCFILFFISEYCTAAEPTVNPTTVGHATAERSHRINMPHLPRVLIM